MTDVSSTGSSTSSTGSSPSLIVNGLVSGIDTTQVIQALLQAYEEPITNLQNEQTSLNTEAGDYRTVNSDMAALQSAAEALNTSSLWNLMTATSSNSAIATATAGPGATAGTIGFTVEQLAEGNVLLSSGGVSSEAATVTSSSSLLAATGAAGIGFSGLSASSGLALGSHSISVTQSSAAATVTSSGALSDTDITDANNTLELQVGPENTYTLNLADGDDSPSELVAAINTAAGVAGAPITASLSESGSLEISTNEQGSNASLSVVGGSALTSLGLSEAENATGTDAVVSVDGTSTTLTSVTAGANVTLNAPSGSITATVASSPGASGALISAGSATAALVSTGDGSLSDLVNNLNSSGLDLTATAVEEASGNYRLQIAAGSTGLSGAATIDSSALSSGVLGSLQTITAAANAEVNVGGSDGYDLESATNTFNNLIAGTAVTVSQTGAASVTVSPDASGEASAVSNLVAAANQALSDISDLTSYDSSTNVAGALNGSVLVENLQQEVLSTFASAAGTSGLGSPGAVGITLSSTGSLSFDQSTFESAFAANPQKVASLFTAGGTFSASSPSYDGEVSFVYANPSSAEGTYDVSISQSASQASDTGAVLSGGVTTAGETLSISSSGNDMTYEVSSGQSLTAIAAGLNAGFATNGLQLSAVVSGGDQLEVESDAYGSAASFSISSSAPGPGTTGLGGAVAGTPVTYAGTDVEGTINGVAGTGSGQTLSAPTSDPTLSGLSLLVTTPGITSTTDLGSFTYTPGLAQQLATIANSASNASTGSITNAINGLSNEATGLNTQIANYTALEESQQTLLTNQFAQMESTLGTLKNESSQLSSEISDLAGF